MNASKILQQLMSQASGSKGSSGGMDVKGVIDGLSRHLGGNSSQGTRQSSGSSGFDVKSLLGGGALGMLVGSKRGRSMAAKRSSMVPLRESAYWRGKRGKALRKRKERRPNPHQKASVSRC